MIVACNVILYHDTVPLGYYYDGLKRGTDIILSAVALVVLSPLLLALAIAIKLESPGRVIFKQWRYGQHAKPFIIYKFRTLREDQSHTTGGVQVCDGDNRLTRLGHYLRTRSIDEWPQLYNVLKGDMALVGPRPHAIDHHDDYTGLIPHYDRRLDVLPGMTGLAQINGCRGATPELHHMSDRLEQDRLYIAQRTYWLDVKILFLTVRRCAWRSDHNGTA